MKQRLFPLLIVIGLSVAMLISHPFVAKAQITQGRTVNMENARRLYPMIVDAIAANKISEAAKSLDEFATNLDVLEVVLYKPARETLHELDRNVLFPKVEEVVTRLGKVRGYSKTMIEAIKSVNNIDSSTVGYFKDRWREFDDGFNQLSNDFNAYWRLMTDRMKRLQEVCGRDCS